MSAPWPFTQEEWDKRKAAESARDCACDPGAGVFAFGCTQHRAVLPSVDLLLPAARERAALKHRGYADGCECSDTWRDPRCLSRTAGGLQPLMPGGESTKDQLYRVRREMDAVRGSLTELAALYESATAETARVAQERDEYKRRWNVVGDQRDQAYALVEKIPGRAPIDVLREVIARGEDARIDRDAAEADRDRANELTDKIAAELRGVTRERDALARRCAARFNETQVLKAELAEAVAAQARIGDRMTEDIVRLTAYRRQRDLARAELASATAELARYRTIPTSKETTMPATADDGPVAIQPLGTEAALSNALKCYDELQSVAGRKYEELGGEIKEWSDIAYELWALACNSTTDGHSTEAEWKAARERLGERFHAALSKLHAELPDRGAR